MNNTQKSNRLFEFKNQTSAPTAGIAWAYLESNNWIVADAVKNYQSDMSTEMDDVFESLSDFDD